MHGIIDPRYDNKVAIFNDENCYYSSLSPYHPNRLYPEYPFPEDNIDFQNNASLDSYHAIREAIRLLGYDSQNFNTKEWNPFGGFITENSKVVIKPNFVVHVNESKQDIYAIITHPSVIRAICDYCIIALKGSGKISIVESPDMECDFEKIVELTGIDKLFDFYKRHHHGIEFEIHDVRRLKCKFDYEKGYFPSDSFVVNESADPLGYSIIDLGKKSFLDGITGLDKLYGADYDRKFTSMNHNNGTHKYCVSNSILDADTIVCIPKLKTHKKVGLTLNIKLLVGINCDKNYLAHYRIGTPEEGGDEFPESDKANVTMQRYYNRLMSDHILKKRSLVFDKLYLSLRKVLKPVIDFLRSKKLITPPTNTDKIRAGNWFGNDTAWRMAADLSKILIYSDKSGLLQTSPQRNVISFIDGIIGGEKDGPLGATPKHTGSIIAGRNILAVDSAAASYIGFDFLKIKMFKFLWEDKDQQIACFKPNDTKVMSNNSFVSNKNISNCFYYSFAPHANWKNHIELEDK